jgi:glucose/arabinose dehydrogenase
LNPDGTTPRDQAGATPVYAVGYRSPRGLDWQPATGMLWAADASPQESTRLDAVASGERESKRGTRRVTRLIPGSASSIAFYRSDLISAFRGNLLVSGDQRGDLLRVRFDASDPTRPVAIERLLVGQTGALRVVAVAPDGTIYLCTEDALLSLAPLAGS